MCGLERDNKMKTKKRNSYLFKVREKKGRKGEKRNEGGKEERKDRREEEEVRKQRGKIREV